MSIQDLTLSSASSGPSSDGGFIHCDTDPLQRGLKADLVLKSGPVFSGYSFGSEVNVAGEVVFNTGMVGYPESLTDPSYAGQILVLTYPLIGNYGVPDENVLDAYGLPKYFEGKKVHVKAVICAEYSFESSHYLANKTLAKWLKEQGVPGIYGIDTRALTKLIRSEGSVLGKVVLEDPTSAKIPATINLPHSPIRHDVIDFEDPNLKNLPATVSCTEKIVYKPDLSGSSSSGNSSCGGESGTSCGESSESIGESDVVLDVDCEGNEQKVVMGGKKKKVPRIMLVDFGVIISL